MIQVGVLKTHQLMRLTGGVKLTFGCITGLSKAQLHVRAQKREDFADMLLDLHLAMRPRFTIIDGIIAMEGQGPGSGTPRELGSLFAAHDAVALDVALADRTAHAAALRLHDRRLGAPRPRRPRRSVSPRRRPDRAGARVQARGARHAGAAAAVAASHGAQPHHRAAAPRRRGGVHEVRGLRRDLRRERHHPAPEARLRRPPLRALLRLHRGLPHRGHRQRRAARSRASSARAASSPPPPRRYWCCGTRLSTLVLPAAVSVRVPPAAS